MTESPQLRISDQNRESALTALGEHMTAGRIDIEEYGERSARITAAKTRGELVEIFADLPAPHPQYDEVPQAVAAPQAQQEAAPAPRHPGSPEGWTGPQRFIASFIPLIWIATIALIATGVVHGALILVPIGLSVFGRSMWGHGGRDHERHHRRHEQHLHDRERRRALRDSYRDQRRGLDH